MTDTVLRGTGNSRTLRTVSNAKTLYPTWDSALTALINGTFPIDIGPLNSAGLSRRGTDLNKPNILTDATATGMGLTSSATPNDAFAKLRALVKAAQDDATTALTAGVSVQIGSYAGADADRKTIQFSRPWHIFSVETPGPPLVRGVLFWKGCSCGVKFSSTNFDTADVLSYTDTSITFSSKMTYSTYAYLLNESGNTYNWWAI